MSVNVTSLTKDKNIINEEFMTIALNISEMFRAEGKTRRPFISGLTRASFAK